MSEKTMPHVVRKDGYNFKPKREHVTWWVNQGWYLAAIDGSLEDCTVRTICLLLSAGF